MRISQRIDYALRALVLLALLPQGEYVAAGELAQRLTLPRRFVEQQVTMLARAGIVTCRRGALGGCALARPAELIDIRQIVVGLQGEVIDVPQNSGSAAAEVWQQAAAAVESQLSATSLAQVAARQRELDVAAATMYYI